LPIVPITFADNKKRFSYTFFSGGPGLLRVRIHSHVDTTGKIISDKNTIREQVWKTIHTQLLKFELKSS
jgi:1-acyl-sn-glycerol-3-phosphate acyltransferase